MEGRAMDEISKCFNTEAFKELLKVREKLVENDEKVDVANIEKFCLKLLTSSNDEDLCEPLYRLATSCIILLCAQNEHNYLSNVASVILSSVEDRPLSSCNSLYALGCILEAYSKNIMNLVQKALRTILPTLQSTYKGGKNPRNMKEALNTLSKIVSIQDLVIDSETLNQIKNVTENLVTSDIHVRLAGLELACSAYEKEMVLLSAANSPNASDKNQGHHVNYKKLFSKFTEISKTEDKRIRSRVSDLISIIIRNHWIALESKATKKRFSKEDLEYKDEHKSKSREPFQSPDCALQDHFKHLWQIYGKSTSAYVRHTIILTYSKTIELLGHKAVEEDCLNLINIFLKLIDIDPTSKDEETFNYICYVGQLIIRDAFISNASEETKKSILKLITKNFLLPWSYENKDEAKLKPSVKICIISIFSYLISSAELSDILIELELSNILVELINTLPLDIFDCLLMTFQKLCLYSTLSPKKLIPTIFALFQQELSLVLSQKVYSDRLRKYSSVLSVILAGTVDRVILILEPLIHNLLDTALLMIDVDKLRANAYKRESNLELLVTGLILLTGLIKPISETLDNDINVIVVILEKTSEFVVNFDGDDMSKEISRLEVRINSLNIFICLLKNLSRDKLNKYSDALLSILHKCKTLCSNLLVPYKKMLRKTPNSKNNKFFDLIDLLIKRTLKCYNFASEFLKVDNGMMYLACSVMCIEKNLHPDKQSVGLNKIHYVPPSASLCLNIINKIDCEYDGFMSNKNAHITNNGSLADMISSPFTPKYWFIDNTYFCDHKNHNEIEALCKDKFYIQEYENNGSIHMSPPNYIGKVEEAIMAISKMYEFNEIGYTTDFIDKLEKSFFIETNLPRFESSIMSNMANILTSLYYILERSSQSSKWPPLEHCRAICSMAIKGLKSQNELVGLLSCQVISLLFNNPAMAQFLQGVLDIIMEDPSIKESKLSSLALGHIMYHLGMYESEKDFKKVVHYICDTCIKDEKNLRWHMHGIAILIQAPGIKGDLARVILHLISVVYFKFPSNTTENRGNALIYIMDLGVSITFILESIINIIGPELDANPEDLSLIRTLYEGLKMSSDLAIVFGAIKCTKTLILLHIDIVDIMLEAELLLNAILEKNREFLLPQGDVILCLLFIVERNNPEVNEYLRSKSVERLLLYMVNSNMKPQLSEIVNNIIIRLNTKDNADLVDKWIELNNYVPPHVENTRPYLNHLAMSSPSRESERNKYGSDLLSSGRTSDDSFGEKGSDSSKEIPKLSKTSKKGLDNKIIKTKLKQYALHILYGEPKIVEMRLNSDVYRVYSLSYLGKAIEESTTSYLSSNSKPLSSSQNSLYDIFGQVVKISCLAINSEGYYLCCEGLILLYKIFKGLLSVKNSDPDSRDLVFQHYQAQISAVIKRILLLDHSLKLNVIALKVFIMQIKACASEDISSVAREMDFLINETLRHIQECRALDNFSDYHILMRNAFTVVWLEVLEDEYLQKCAFEISSLNNMCEVYEMCFAVFREYGISSTRIMDKVVKTMKFEFNSSSQKVEFLKFFSDLTKPYDDRTSAMIILKSLIDKDDEIFEKIMFGRVNKLDDKNGMINVIGIVTMALDIIDELLHRINSLQSGSNGDSDQGLNESEYSNMRTAFIVLVRILIMSISEDDARNFMMNLLEKLYSLSYTRDQTLKNICFSVLSTISSNIHVKSWEFVVEYLAKIIVRLLKEYILDQSESDKQDSELAEFLLVKSGEILRDIILCPEFVDVNLKTTVPYVFCILSSLSYSKTYAYLAPVFLGIFANNFRILLDKGDKERLKKLVQSQLLTLLNISNRNMKENNDTVDRETYNEYSLYTATVLFLDFAEICHARNFPEKMCQLIKCYTRSVYKLKIISIGCISNLFSLALTSRPEHLRLIGSYYIKYFLPLLITDLEDEMPGEYFNEVVKLVIYITNCVKEGENKDLLLKYVVGLFSVQLVKKSDKLEKDSEAYIEMGKFFISLATTHKSFKTIIESLSQEATSQLKECITNASNQK